MNPFLHFHCTAIPDKLITINQEGKTKDTYRYYEFIDSTYQLDGQTIRVYLDGGKDYKITLSVKGTTATDTDSNTYAILNSIPENVGMISRINRINANTILSYNGQIAWPAQDGATGYLVNVLVAGDIRYTYTITPEELESMLVDEMVNDFFKHAGPVHS